MLDCGRQVRIEVMLEKLNTILPHMHIIHVGGLSWWGNNMFMVWRHWSCAGNASGLSMTVWSRSRSTRRCGLRGWRQLNLASASGSIPMSSRNTISLPTFATSTTTFDPTSHLYLVSHCATQGLLRVGVGDFGGLVHLQQHRGDRRTPYFVCTRLLLGDPFMLLTPLFV